MRGDLISVDGDCSVTAGGGVHVPKPWGDQTLQKLLPKSLGGVGCAAPRTWVSPPAPGNLLYESQCVLPDVDQASQGLYRLLGRWGSVRKLSETKWEKAVCLERWVTVPHWHKASGLTKNRLSR